MDKYLKKLKPAMLEYLYSHYEKEDAENRWQKTVELDEKWIREEGDIGGNKNMFSKDLLLCYATCAFYEAVDRNYSSEDFAALVNEVMKTPFKLMNKLDMNKLEKKKGAMQIAYRYFSNYKKKADKYRGNKWGNTCKLEINPEKKETGFAFTLYSCPLYEFAKKHGYTDFLPNLCSIDHMMAKALHAKLIRHSRLSAGDDCCAYWFVGDRSENALKNTDSK